MVDDPFLVGILKKIPVIGWDKGEPSPECLKNPTYGGPQRLSFGNLKNP